VDHIKPVIEGGGTCDIDNLRTLCVLCHREVTAQLHRDRAEQRHKREAAKCGDITAFFKVKWITVLWSSYKHFLKWFFVLYALQWSNYIYIYIYTHTHTQRSVDTYLLFVWIM